MELRLYVEQRVSAGQFQDHVVGIVDPHAQDLACDDELAALEERVHRFLVSFVELRQARAGHALHRADHRQFVQR
ncbi:hypothetical protein FQZ97_1180580 [compost metagenome]